MGNLDIYNDVRCVPDDAKRRINGGRLNGKTDINPMWRIKKLTEQFGPCGVGWYIKVTNKRLETYGDEVAAFVDIELYIKVDGEWSQPIFGTGGNMFAEKEKSGIHVSDEAFKMAVTDAISVACKMLGVGADVYWESDKTKYSSKSSEKHGGANEKQTTVPPQGKLDPQSYSERVRGIIAQCNRTNTSLAEVLKRYKVDNVENMSDLQIKSCMNVFMKM
jgi:hypothetical protein|nr:MAG TPA: DNA repair protein-like protein [Caudoviricetes sp.]